VRFGEPWGLLLLLPWVFVAFYMIRRTRWKSPELPVPALSALPRHGGLRVRLVRVAGWLLPLATFLFLIAAARPQAGHETREIVSQGIDIMIAIDVSGSMRCEDFRPQNRLFVAKSVAKEFLRGRTQDRIGLIAFAGRSELISPLTLDYEGLAALIDGIDFAQLPDGTAVVAAIAQGAQLLREAKWKSKVLILLTDGINNAGAVDPITAARLAAAVGVRVYTVGAGTLGQAPYPIDDPIAGRHYVWVRSEIDEESLGSVAAITRGRYFRATNAELLSQVFRDIDAMEPSQVEMRSYTQWAELGPGLLAAGAIFMTLSLVLGATFLRRYP
jgi:Ca-activated chloride channel family protein